jgi:peptidyl-Lys metalloendopeptidase
MKFSFSQWAASALICGAAFFTHPALANGLDVRLSAPTPVLAGDVDVTVTVTVTNTLRFPQRIAKAQLPDALDLALFRVTRDGQPVAYTGPLVKRGAPTDADYVRLGAGESLRYEVELTGVYDLSRNGQYAIEYTGLQRQVGPAAPATNARADQAVVATAQDAAVHVSPLYLWLQGRGAPAAGAREATASPQGSVQPLATAAAASITYTGNCTSSQRTALANAVAAATTYSQNALTYLGRTPASTPRYKTWFGTVSTTNWNTVKSHFTKITDALKTKPLTLDCSCRQNYYAYVYADQHYKIYLCPGFFSAPNTGTDSKAGTLIHELSHFTILGGTDDRAYGQSAAKSLAISSPSKAVDNADSHEYFAENTPALQ